MKRVLKKRGSRGPMWTDRGNAGLLSQQRLKLAQRFRDHVDRRGPFDPEFPARHILGQQEYITQDGRARLAGRARRDGNPICPRRAFLARHAPRCVALASLNQRHVHDSSRLDRRQQRLNDRHESGNQRHLVAGENEDSKFAPRKVLLIPETLIGGNKDVNVFFSSSQQLAIPQARPAHFLNSRDVQMR